MITEKKKIGAKKIQLSVSTNILPCGRNANIASTSSAIIAAASGSRNAETILTCPAISRKNAAENAGIPLKSTADIAENMILCAEYPVSTIVRYLVRALDRFIDLKYLSGTLHSATVIRTKSESGRGTDPADGPDPADAVPAAPESRNPAAAAAIRT